MIVNLCSTPNCRGSVFAGACTLCGRAPACPCLKCASDRKAEGHISGATDWRGVSFAGTVR